MAKANRTATEQAQHVLDQIAQEASTLKLSIEAVQCTAISVRLALMQQNAEQDQDIAVCVQRNIVDKLGYAIDQFEALVDTVRKLPSLAAIFGPQDRSQ